MELRIEKAAKGDLVEILALQKLAFRQAAEVYGDLNLPPLRQTLEGIEEEFERRCFLKALADGALIGSVRAHEEEGVCYIGRLMVDPSFQDRGIGRRLMAAIEARFPGARRFEVFTGFRDEKNLYFYRKLGYRKLREQKVNDALSLVFMEKKRNIVSP